MSTDKGTPLGGNVRRLRKREGMSQAGLAEQMRAQGHENWHPTTVSRVENGQQHPRVTEIAALQRILGPEVIAGPAGGAADAPAPRGRAVDVLFRSVFGEGGDSGVATRIDKLVVLPQLQQARAELVAAIERIDKVRYMLGDDVPGMGDDDGQS